MREHPTPVVELLRVSTDTQADPARAGLDAQRTANRATAQRYRLQVVDTVEVVESGSTVATSPAMQHTLSLLTTGTARGILLAEYSRLFRPHRWSDLAVLQTIEEAGAQIYLPSGPIDLSSELGFVQASVGNLLAALERRRIRERMHRGKEEHRKRGEHVAGGVGIPFGLAYSKAEGWSWTDDAPLVAELFRRFLSGEHQYESLSRDLALPRTTVKFLLQNPVYTGWREIRTKKDLSAAGRLPSGHRRNIPREPDEVIRTRLDLTPLVSEDDFRRVQSLIHHKDAQHVRYSRVTQFLYSGMLRCALCDLAMYAGSKGRRQLSKGHYYCRSAHPQRRPAATATCATGFLASHIVEAELDLALTERLLDPDLLARALTEYQRQQLAPPDAASPAGAFRQNRRAQLEAKRKRILDAFVDGVLHREERDRRLTTLAAELQALDARPPELLTPPPLHVTAALVESLVSLFAEWTFLGRPEKRNILEALQPVLWIERTGRGKCRATAVLLPDALVPSSGDSGSHLPEAV
jgi:DNA invertase Pin-like site-specific DNA recombinase